jgi:hypothetical protein
MAPERCFTISESAACEHKTAPARLSATTFQDVEPPVDCPDVLEQCADCSAVGNVGTERRALGACLFDRAASRFGFLVAAVIVDDDAVTVGGKAQHDRAPDSARTAGHERNAIATHGVAATTTASS